MNYLYHRHCGQELDMKIIRILGQGNPKNASGFLGV